MDTNATVTLDEVTERLLLLTERPESYYARIKELVIEGYMELNITTISNATHLKEYTMDVNNVVYLDRDVLNVEDVVIPIDGKMWSLTRNKHIVPPNVELVPESGQGAGTDITAELGVYYAARGGNNTEGYYKYEKDKRRLVFTNIERSNVIVLYTSSGVSMSGITYIPKEVRSAISNYVLWQLEHLSPKNKFNKALSYKQEYERQKSILRNMDFNWIEFKDAVYSTLTASFYRGN